jgi:transcriptional regulator with PAS, ATPase and Fis domain
LNVCRINIPPLRERAQDIAILARHFLSKFTTASGKSVTLSSGAVELLMLHSWPGNVRELSHVLQRAIVLLNRGDDTLTKRHIEESLHSRNRAMAAEKQYARGPLKASEKEYVAASLMTYDWNVSRTAVALGIDRRTLQRKITRYQILR